MLTCPVFDKENLRTGRRKEEKQTVWTDTQDEGRNVGSRDERGRSIFAWGQLDRANEFPAVKQEPEGGSELCLPTALCLTRSCRGAAILHQTQIRGQSGQGCPGQGSPRGDAAAAPRFSPLGVVLGPLHQLTLRTSLHSCVILLITCRLSSHLMASQLHFRTLSRTQGMGGRVSLNIGVTFRDVSP